jgi:4-amino-4-deoxy-L-arabinose transferase-like glycosyltransferase
VKERIRRCPLTCAILVLLVVAGSALRIGYAADRSSQQPPDSVAYAQIAENLYRHGSFDARPPGVTQEVQPSSSYSPGLPLFVAAVYLVSGGVHLELALILLALLGAAAIPMTFLLGKRLAGPTAGLIGAFAVAIYPALLQYQGLLLTEPLAAFLLSAGLVVFFSAADRGAGPWPWMGCGALFGALALVRPEYLPLVLGLPLLWLAREARHGSLRRAWPAAGLSMVASLLVLAPWTIHNAVALDRFVPVATGGGKALYIGTYLDAGGDGPKLRELLLSQRPALRRQLERGGALDDPHRRVLERVLERVAGASYPNLESDAALGRLGRENLEDDITKEPVRFAEMLVDKGYQAWTDSARSVMERQPWRLLQLSLVVLALIGLLLLALRRRFEALVLGLLLAFMTAVAAVLISSPRRELVVLPVLAALSGVAVTAAADSVARWRS